MDWTLEVVVLPVSDIDRSIAFYRDRVGFHLDHDTQNEYMHVTQLTPPGSGCSIVFGDLPPHHEMEPGSMKNLQLVVSDAAAARQELLDRGVEVSELAVVNEADGGTFFGFNDPDGNTWAIQEIRGSRSQTPHPQRSCRPQRMGRPMTRGRRRGRTPGIWRSRQSLAAVPLLLVRARRSPQGRPRRGVGSVSHRDDQGPNCEASTRRQKPRVQTKA